MKNCSKCGASFAEVSASGLCPACLLRDLGGADTNVDLFPSGGGGMHPRIRYFGEYELMSELGRGGMGVVYQARQLTLDRQVALKMIVAGGFAPTLFAERFRMEARAIASLDHPNIVPLYEAGEYEGQQYFTMKLVEGAPLSQTIKSGGLELPAAVRLVSKLAHAAHYAHQRGILHRDLKPGNILINAEGEPFIVDFGLAKALEADPSVTATGVAGTPAYMAPEQFDPQGRTFTTGVDVYSLGAILYELLAGRPPLSRTRRSGYSTRL